MKLIIAGGRDFTDKARLFDVCRKHIKDMFDDVIVSGRCTGADQLGEEFAEYIGLDIMPFAADWGAHGHAAGIYRNREMARYADALVAFWDGRSKGTSNMIHTMMDYNKETHVYFYEPAENDNG